MLMIMLSLAITFCLRWVSTFALVLLLMLASCAASGRHFDLTEAQFAPQNEPPGCSLDPKTTPRGAPRSVRTTLPEQRRPLREPRRAPGGPGGRSAATRTASPRTRGSADPMAGGHCRRPRERRWGRGTRELTSTIMLPLPTTFCLRWMSTLVLVLSLML